MNATCIIPNCRRDAPADEAFCARHRPKSLLSRAREYVTDSLEAHEHSDGRELLNAIDDMLA